MADKKITALTALGAADKAADDRLHIIDYSASPVNKQISITNLFSQVPVSTSIVGASKEFEVGFGAASVSALKVTNGATATAQANVIINDDGNAYVDFTVKADNANTAISVESARVSDAGNANMVYFNTNQDTTNGGVDVCFKGTTEICMYVDNSNNNVIVGGAGTTSGAAATTDYRLKVVKDTNAGGGITSDGFISFTGTDNVAPAAGGTAACSVTTSVSRLTVASGSAATVTLAAGKAGQVKHIICVVDNGGSVTLDQTNVTDPASAITFQDAGDSWTGYYDGTLTKWITIGGNGYAHG